MTKQKLLIIAGGIAIAAAAIYYIKKKEKPAEEFIPVQGPKNSPTYAQPGSEGGGANLGTGGGAPSTKPEGVTTPETPREKEVKLQTLQGNITKHLGIHEFTNPTTGEKQRVGVGTIAK